MYRIVRGHIAYICAVAVHYLVDDVAILRAPVLVHGLVALDLVQTGYNSALLLHGKKESEL